MNTKYINKYNITSEGLSIPPGEYIRKDEIQDNRRLQM